MKITKQTADLAYWRLCLEYCRTIYGCLHFFSEESIHHSPLLSKDAFNLISRINKLTHTLCQYYCDVLYNLEKEHSHEFVKSLGNESGK